MGFSTRILNASQIQSALWCKSQQGTKGEFERIRGICLSQSGKKGAVFLIFKQLHSKAVEGYPLQPWTKFMMY